MSKSLTISGVTYNYPENGTEPSWGEEASGWAEAVTNLLASLNTDGDILTTSFSPANNQSSAANVVGLTFDGTVLQGFVCDYSIYRTNGILSYSETGTVHGAYNTLTSTWEMAISGINVGDTGITLSINNGGQIQYTSTNIVGGTHSCRMVFRARSFLYS